jgi:hypothetical protein
MIAEGWLISWSESESELKRYFVEAGVTRPKGRAQSEAGSRKQVNIAVTESQTTQGVTADEIESFQITCCAGLR